MKITRYLLPLWIIIVLAGCNLPGAQETQSPDAVFTQAAQTVAAELTRVALLASPTPNLPTNTFTPAPTNTPVFTSTYTPIPCNLVSYSNATIDVTVPDNSPMNPGQTFTKIWRLTNAGSCTWTSSYKVTFDSNNGMGKPSGYSQSLGAIVPPGQSVDISVNLTAPVANGTYRGDWSLRTPDNVPMMTFIVVIKVNATPTTVTLSPVSGEGGSVRGDGNVFPGEITIGDSDTNFTLQGFVSYDISAIPTTAVITEVKVDLVTGGYTSFGSPFTLGCLRLYPQDYGSLDSGDLYGGALGSPYVEWCNASDLTGITTDGDTKSLIQSRLGTTRIRMRFQFQTGLSANAAADALRLTSPRLIVTYTAP